MSLRAGVGAVVPTTPEMPVVAPAATAPTCGAKSTAAIAQLTAPDAATRMQAIASLGWYSEPCAVLPLLQLAIGDSDRDVRTRAIVISAEITAKHADSVDLASVAIKTYASIMSDATVEAILRDYATNAFTKVNDAVGLAALAAEGNTSAKFKLWFQKYKYGILAIVLGGAAGGIAWHHRRKNKAMRSNVLPPDFTHRQTQRYSY